jgi:tetratricopeptide (TPR) repeat protein
MIHSFDYPALAPLAIDAARAYAKIAPDAPHALHMPSHIFTRLGLWQESIESNLASRRTAQAGLAKSHPGATAFDALHAMDYLEYAYLQTARDAEAQGVVDGTAKATSFDAPTFSAGYALAAVPARNALERRDWKSAAGLAPSPAFPWEKFPYAEAIVHFARAVGAARLGDIATARAAVDRLTALQAGLQGQKGFDWASQVEIQRRAAAGWLARAEKKDDEAVTLLRSAADLEDTTDKHPVTPGAVLPAREQLADLLAELGQPKAALAEYELSLKTAPARYNGLLGAALAAERSGAAAKATELYGQLAALCKGGTSERARQAESRVKVAAN